jgi:hypothetical protein
MVLLDYMSEQGVIIVGDKCNTNCPGCFTGSGTIGVSYLNLEIGKRFIQESSKLGVTRQSFEGGEPTQGFYGSSNPTRELIEYSTNLGLKTQLITNGNWILEQIGEVPHNIAQFFADHDTEVVFSIDAFHNSRSYNANPVPLKIAYSAIVHYLQATGRKNVIINQISPIDDNISRINELIYGQLRTTLDEAELSDVNIRLRNLSLQDSVQSLKDEVKNNILYDPLAYRCPVAVQNIPLTPRLNHNGDLSFCASTVLGLPFTLGNYASLAANEKSNLLEKMFNHDPDILDDHIVAMLRLWFENSFGEINNKENLVEADELIGKGTCGACGLIYSKLIERDGLVLTSEVF